MGDSPNRAARSLGLRVGSRPLGLGHVGGRPAGSEYLGQHVPRVTPGTRARTQAIQASPPALGLHGVGHVGGWPVASPCPARTQGFPWNERVGLQLAGVTPSPGPAWGGKDSLLLLAMRRRRRTQMPKKPSIALQRRRLVDPRRRLHRTRARRGSHR